MVPLRSSTYLSELALDGNGHADTLFRTGKDECKLESTLQLTLFVQLIGLP